MLYCTLDHTTLHEIKKKKKYTLSWLRKQVWPAHGGSEEGPDRQHEQRPLSRGRQTTSHPSSPSSRATPRICHLLTSPDGSLQRKVHRSL